MSTYDALNWPGPLYVTCDGRVVARVADSEAAFQWILKHQGQSVGWALAHGYGVRPAPPEDDTDAT